ncbi:hypothetical protein Bbelb_227140 [Branchiostoma belcheri]|nr:hypothetical protein Bbelb_227140 [Branchiostoma belcheri]
MANPCTATPEHESDGGKVFQAPVIHAQPGRADPVVTHTGKPEAAEGSPGHFSRKSATIAGRAGRSGKDVRWRCDEGRGRDNTARWETRGTRSSREGCSVATGTRSSREGCSVATRPRASKHEESLTT